MNSKKNVLLVDDSIVGATSKQIIEMARESGASKVYFASAAPPVRYPNVYGIDMPATSEFVANDRTIDEINQHIKSNSCLSDSRRFDSIYSEHRFGRY